MKTLLVSLSVAVLLGGGVIAATSAKKPSVKGPRPTLCMNDYSCQMDERCVKYPPQTEGFCAKRQGGASPSAFEPPPADDRRPASRANCKIAAGGQCLKTN